MSSPPHDSSTGPATPDRCVSCDTELQTPIACLACHAIFPDAPDLSHFRRLGVPEQFDLDLTEAEQRFLELTRQLHPDFHTDADAARQTLSLEHSAKLNAAITTLRDPFKRAVHLLQCWYPESVKDRDQQMPTGFLEDMLLLREDIEDAIAEARSPERTARLESLHADITARRDALEADLRDGFAGLDKPPQPDAAPSAAVDAIRHALNAARYILGTLAVLADAQD